MENSQSLQYNFYNCLATQTKIDNGVHYSFQGKPNEPNIIVTDGGNVKTYMTESMHLSNDGELVVETNPITNFGKKIVLHFPVKTREEEPTTVLDLLMDTNTKNMGVNLNDLLPQNQDCFVRESKMSTHITFKEPIYTRNKMALPVVEGFREGLESVQKVDSSGNLVFHVFHDGSYIMTKDNERKLEVALDDGSYKAVDTNETYNSTDYLNPTYIPVNEFDNPFEWMECDNVEVDSDEVVRYSLAVNDMVDKSKENFLVLYSFMIFIFISLFSFMFSDSIYRMAISAICSWNGEYNNPKTAINTTKYVEIAITFIIVVTTVTLVFTHPSFEGKVNAGYTLVSFIIFAGVVGYLKQSRDFFGVPEKLRENSPDPQQYKDLYKWNFF
jgi:hypothetical protein